MTDSTNKVFIDSNMLIFAADFQKEYVLEWMNSLYDDIYIHIDVYEELLFSSIRQTIDSFVQKNQWTLFDPFDPAFLSKAEQKIYRNRLADVKDAFYNMNMTRIETGKKAKTVSNIGEIATITACMMINARIICSNDFDIRTVIDQEDYRVLIGEQDVLLIQDSAEDFCVSCFQNKITSRKKVRTFYRSIIVESPNRKYSLDQLDKRLDEVGN